MNKDLRNSFLISFAYVGLGTLSLLFVHNSNILVPIVLLLTLPVSFIGFGIAYSERDATMLILLVQLIMFLSLWAILYYRFKKRSAKR